jgi:hypothetical protein
MQPVTMSKKYPLLSEEDSWKLHKRLIVERTGPSGFEPETAGSLPK